MGAIDTARSRTQRTSASPKPLTLIFGLVIFAFLQLRGLHTSMFSFHASRQTQTAWTIRTIARGGPIWRYETPINGPPWSLPFELPTYQVIVGKLVAWFGVPLEPTARAVSAGFTVASLALALAVLRCLGRAANERKTFALLFLLSPVVSFWSHAISIQTTTMCIALLWLLGILRWRLQGSRLWLGVAIVAGLAAPTKLTGFVPAYIFAVIMILRDVASRTTGLREMLVTSLKERFAGTAAAMATPLSAVLVWTSFTSDVFASRGSSFAGLQEQVFGTLEERKQFAKIARAILRAFNLGAGSLLFVLALMVLAVAQRSLRWNLRSFGFQALLPFLLTPLLFFHLHLIHDYYTVETVVYLLFGLSAISVTVATPNQRPTGQGSRSNTEKSPPDTLRRSPRFVAIWVVSVIVCCAQYGRFYDRYDLNAVDFPPALVEAIQRTTPPNEMLLIHHGSYDSSVGYRADRRSLILVTTNAAEIEAAFQRAFDFDRQIGGAVLIGVRSAEYKKQYADRGFVRIGEWNGHEVWDLPSSAARTVKSTQPA